MIAAEAMKAPAHTGFAAKAWMRALSLTAPMASHPGRTLQNVIREHAAVRANTPALVSDRESFTYGQLARRIDYFARWAIFHGIDKGDVVCLLMPNRPEYLAIWLGITSVGGVVALLNTNLTGGQLAHSVRAVRPKHAIVCATLASTLCAALQSADKFDISVHGGEYDALPRIAGEADSYPCNDPILAERSRISLLDPALYIYTSGTTGMPKAAKVSHARIMQWSLWFAGMMNVTPDDRIYDCLPMYHSVGGVQAPGAMLVAGASAAIGEHFSARSFFHEVSRWQCTLFQYIGELCRYLLLSPPSPHDTEHKVRLACGNGLAPDVWSRVQKRFGIPSILEFYASTEGAVSLFNAEGRPGAIGRVPGYLAHRFAPSLIHLDMDTGEPLRDDRGFCIRCATHQVGEAIGRLSDDPSHLGSRFEGYTDSIATDRLFLRNVFADGDAWVRTGDLMRKDEKGFFYFVDRLGDTFRWKGENVATTEVAGIISACPHVTSAVVYGVQVPGTEGRAGMAAVSVDSLFDVQELRQQMAESLPRYARPVFLRIRDAAAFTGTLKYVKSKLAHEAFDPSATTDALYLDRADVDAFVPIDEDIYARIQSGLLRL